MLLQSLDILNVQGSILHLVLDDSTTGFSVKNIEGLDPVAATISSGTFAGLDGEQFYAAKRQKRNIKITLGLNPNFALADVKTLRDQLYAYFMPKSSVQMSFNLYDRFADTLLEQNLTLNISGIVESFDTVLFSQSPEVSISLLCFNPDFVDPNVIEIAGSTGTNYQDPYDIQINYKGTISTGFRIQLFATGDTTGADISNLDPSGKMHSVQLTLALAGPPNNTDWVDISSVPGNKYVRLHRYGSTYDENAEGFGVTYQVLYAISAQSAWLELLPGLNQFRINSDGAALDWKIKYTNKYGGL